jgi:hypothetical protein
LSDIASLAPSGGGGGIVKVDAPWRISRKGHSTFGCALATGCGSFCVAPEKKLAILSLNEGVLGGEGAGGVAAGVEGGVAAGAAAGVEEGVAAGVDAVVTGDPTLPLPHPALSNNKASNAAAAGRWHRGVSPNPRKVPRLIAHPRSSSFIANQL